MAYKQIAGKTFNITYHSSIVNCTSYFDWHHNFVQCVKMPDKNKDKESEPKINLFEKAINFFHKYDTQLNQIRELLDIRLSQLALAYTRENKLPKEALTIKTRVKTADSFLKKMEKLDMNDFHFPDNIVYDLIGARVTCWFLDDCKGFSDFILGSNFITVDPGAIHNYIDNPKPSGYRSIHLHGRISFESIISEKGNVKFIPEKIICEIQVRTKLMDAWADLTHEFHYKAKDYGIEDINLETILASQAKRLYSEDESFLAIRNMYQKNG